MTTHNARIYHCQACGRVVHVDPQAPPPRCCGRAMTGAGEVSIRDDAAGLAEGNLIAADLPEVE